MTEQQTRDVCPECRKDFVRIASGKIRVHKVRGEQCSGTGADPYRGQGVDTGHQCRVCKSPVQLTSNGRVRSHLNRDAVPAPCPGGSDWPLGAYPDLDSSDVATAGDGSWKPPESQCVLDGIPHRFEYGDDDNGHEGSFCVGCGIEEPVQHEMTGRDTVKARPVGGQSADDFLGAAKTSPGTGVAADDFLSGGEDDSEDAEDQAPPWFESRHDGSCDSCGLDFDAGARIRADGSGGWEAEDCCGDPIETTREARTEQAKALADRPRVASPQLPVRNGRYVAPHPETGKQTKYTRTTTFAETLADSIALDQWKGRMTVLGMGLRKDLVDKARSAVQGGAVPYEVAREHRTFLNGLVEEAKLAAGSKDRARKGTILHKHTQEIDAGRRSLSEVPDEFRPDVAAYLAAMEQAGFRLLPHLIERSVLTGELKVVGTFDRIIEVLRDQEARTLNGRPVQLHKGDHVIGDVKSGASLEFPWPEIEIQLSIYAHAVNENGVAVPEGEGSRTTWRWAPLSEFGAPRVREDVGIVMHMPYGEKQCSLHYADLVEGWRGAKLCKVVREWRKTKFPDDPALVVTAPEEPSGESVNGAFTHAPAGDHDDSEVLPVNQWASWPDRFRAVKTKAEALTAWRQAKKAGLPADRLEELVEIGRTALKAVETYTVKEPSWEEKFRAVTSKAEGSARWREAKEAGLPADRLKELVALVRLEKPSAPVSGPPTSPAAGATPSAPPAPPVTEEPPAPPTLEERAAAVTSRAEASALFQEMKADVDTLGKPRIAAVVALMQETLQKAPAA